MTSVYIEVSLENGFVLAVYNEGEDEPIFGKTIPVVGLEDEIAKGIRYKVTLDSIVKVEELLDYNTVVEEVSEKSGIYFIDPFDEEERAAFEKRRKE